jgi:hypothetical protein
MDLELPVDEQVLGFKRVDPRHPAQGQTTEPQPVFDNCAYLDLGGLVACDRETQPGRGYALEVACPREEIEDVWQRESDPLLGPEYVTAHQVSTSRSAGSRSG